MEMSATRASAYARHRDGAHAVAVDELEQLRSRLPADLGIIKASLGATTTFEGDTIVTTDSGVSVTETTELGKLPASIERYVVVGDSKAWIRIVVIVTWVEGTVDRSVRFETGVPLLERATG